MSKIRKMKKGGFSVEGFRYDSPDRGNSTNTINSRNISMSNVPHPVMGIDGQGNSAMMHPGGEYRFPSAPVTEYPMRTGGSYGTPIAMSNLGNPVLQYGGMSQYGNYIAMSNLGNPLLEYGGGIPMSNVGSPLIPGLGQRVPQPHPSAANRAQNGLMEFGGIMNHDPYDPIYRNGGNWIKGAVNPDHKGYCTPMTKSTCTPRRKAFAQTMKKHHGFHKQWGGSAIPDDVTAGRDTAMNNTVNNPDADPLVMFNDPNDQPVSPQYPTNDQPVDMMDNRQYTPPAPQQGINPWPTFVNGVQDLAVAGIGLAQDRINRNNQKATDNWMVQQGTSDNAFRRYNSAGSKGDYDVNQGYFRPQQNTPVRAGMYLPKMNRYGGPQRMDIGGGLLTVPQGPMAQFSEAVQPQMPQPPVHQPRSNKDIAVSTNNPGNMKFSEWMANYGGQPSGIPGTDGGEFAAFPDIQKGLDAYKTQLFGDTDGVFKSRYYKPTTTVDKALKTWSNKGYGVEIYPELKGKKLGDLSEEQRHELVKRQIKRESPSMFQQLHEQGYYKVGGLYDASASDIMHMRDNGYEIEYITD